MVVLAVSSKTIPLPALCIVLVSVMKALVVDNRYTPVPPQGNRVLEVPPLYIAVVLMI